MTYRYEAKVTLGDGIGHLAAAGVRDALEDALAGAMEPGEEAAVGQVSDGELRLSFRMEREMGDVEGDMIRDAVEDALRSCANPGETFAMGEMELVEGPAMSP